MYAVIFFVLTPFIYGFTYCNAWRQGMSRYELEGKIAYIEHEKELKKQALKRKKKHTGRKRNAENRNSIQKATKNNIIKAMENNRMMEAIDSILTIMKIHIGNSKENNRENMLVINLRM